MVVLPVTLLSRRRVLQLCAITAYADVALANSPTPYEVVGWNALTPPGWDPLRSFKNLDEMAGLDDSDPRVKKLNERLRQVLDTAPVIASLDGRSIRMSGFVVPLETSREGLLEFLLVPYFGACIHSPPPAANQIVHVRSERPVKGFTAMSTVWISGVLRVARTSSEHGASGYRMKAVLVEPYTGKR
ncbi:DUF3299 domain-containing protein [Aquincola tertiaricarbonis]|uniref:DUF3299 domain-containing protein n=1 Tax=Aquincola tertiaricarbonis TaxID=391953 RepID=UPI0009FAD9E8|nr:DUF3299 domain-containing protein [Aquincola tertiaricarbonis]